MTLWMIYFKQLIHCKSKIDVTGGQTLACLPGDLMRLSFVWKRKTRGAVAQQACNNKDPSLLKRRENTESLQLYILILGRSTVQ